ncbi:MFS transporter [Fundidesulfovibrio agrisoli]|uniref:MFS transporter n=1 Tax=Fundidesulfovibrio agrisoli TaxID=2922717 RepID=UPI001FADC0C0|nr:MFS transporter [Fundidesulfovibrio agrisoli]
MKEDISSTPEETPSLDKSVVALMSAAAGLFVASIYYNQPMLGILARDFGVSHESVTHVPVLTQVGYAAGLLLIAPLGDRFERRGLIAFSTALLALSLLAAALSPSLGTLIAVSLAIGVTATVAQQVVPMAAQLAPGSQRGRVVGQVMAGLLTGILLARTVSGFVSEYASWRLMFGLAAAATAVLGVLLARKLPRVEPATVMSYPGIMRSLVQLAREHEQLRRSGLVQGLLFGGFVAFWANLALFLEQPPFLAGSTVAGLLGVVGVVGVIAAPLAGRLADKGGQRTVILAGAGAVAVSFACFALFRESWAVLIGGIVLMDVGLQAAMVSNQSRVYALDAAARSRLNTVYMTIMFTGGAIGAAVGAQAFAHFGWAGVCVMGAACAVLALVFELKRPAPAR